MQLALHLRMVLVACTFSLFLVSLSHSSPIRYNDGLILAMKRDTKDIPGSADDAINSPQIATISDNSSQSLGVGGLPFMDSVVNLPPLDQTQTILNHATDGSSDHTLKTATGHNLPPEAADGKVVSPRMPISNVTSSNNNSSMMASTPDSNITIDANASQISIPDSDKYSSVMPLGESDENSLLQLPSKFSSTFEPGAMTHVLSLPHTSFPKYDDFQGKVSQSTYHPFLAEEDTLFSEEPLREYGPAPYETRYRALDDDTNKFDVLKHWGNLAPYYSSPLYPDVQKHKALPSFCKLKQVHMLHR